MFWGVNPVFLLRAPKFLESALHTPILFLVMLGPGSYIPCRVLNNLLYPQKEHYRFTNQNQDILTWTSTKNAMPNADCSDSGSVGTRGAI